MYKSSLICNKVFKGKRPLSASVVLFANQNTLLLFFSPFANETSRKRYSALVGEQNNQKCKPAFKEKLVMERFGEQN